MPRAPARCALALGLAVLVAAAVAAATDARAAAAPVDAKAVEAQRRDLQARVEAVQRELAASESTRADAVDALKSTALAISDANRRLHEIEREQGTAGQALAELASRRAGLEQQVASEQTLLARLLLQQQTGGRHEPLKLLLSGRDPGDIARQLYYLRAIGDLRAKVIGELRAHQLQLHTLADDAQAQRERLATLAREETLQRGALLQQRRAHAQVVKLAAGDIRRQQRELDRLKRDDARLSRLIDRLAELARPRAPSRREPAARPREAPPADPKTLPQERGSPATPTESGVGSRRGTLSMPVRGELVGRFGTPREGSAMSWKGWFIRCALGQEVRAVAAGQVVYADWLRGFGNLLIVDHGDGYMSLYGNNDALLATVGTSVGEGEAVAQAGASGGSAEAGVYFEIRHQGKAVDPASWIGR